MLLSENPQSHLPQFERRLAWATSLSMVPEVGFFGAGPRAWKASYPGYTDDLFLLSFFLHIQFAHNDFLHYLVEWGWLGGGAWITLWLLIIVGGGISFWERLEGRASWSRRDWMAFAAWLSVGSCVAHAQVDFPLQSTGVLVTAMACSALALADPSFPYKRKKAKRTPNKTKGN